MDNDQTVQEDIKACGQEIEAVLLRYSCEMRFQEQWVNGQLVSAGIMITKKQALVHGNGNGNLKLVRR
jgi:hypothetical protein